MKENYMKNITKNLEDDDLRPEYDFDFSKSKPNHYAAILRKQEKLIQLEPDVAKHFTTTEQVNNALRAIISAIPKTKKSLAKTT